ncbi:hypothetical protein HAHE_27370 [Haloferula helveola]|uniref:HTH araC/xylS-type domain-containing protein n=1 Tax=Haloferula helveola TaxID=490095 RepID=A0ABM7RGA5_9BACT|nr:hypothetical protein HAHE_27370 [Haloferula helveola]
MALVLPWFYEYARALREGVVEWCDLHPGWRLIELELRELSPDAEFDGQVDGVICWSFESGALTSILPRTRIPLLDAGLGHVVDGRGELPAGVTFERADIHRLALRHFHELGLEVVGYAGARLRRDGQLAPRVAGMRADALMAGMEWVEFDFGPVDPVARPETIWKSDGMEELDAFLAKVPKPLGLLAQDDYFALSLVERAQRLGVRVPEELAVLGQGDRLVSNSGGLRISSVQLPGREVGWKLAELLDAWFAGRPPDPWRRTVPCKRILTRESTGGLSLDPGIERARRHLERHALDGVTVHELAGVAGCTEKTLKSRFAKAYGIDIAVEVRERRKEHALSLLADTDMPIARVGRECGFPSPSNFFNFVRRQTGGLGPAEYRRRMRSDR